MARLARSDDRFDAAVEVAERRFDCGREDTDSFTEAMTYSVNILRQTRHGFRHAQTLDPQQTVKRLAIQDLPDAVFPVASMIADSWAWSTGLTK